MPQEAVKMAGKSHVKRKCQLGQQKCYPLEPVLEHVVANVDEAPRKEQSKQWEGKQRFKSKGVLSRLRDGYVRLMNDMASSADLTGVSAVYGCSTGQVDFPGTTATTSMRSAREDEEIEQLAQMVAASQSQKKH